MRRIASNEELLDSLSWQINSGRKVAFAHNVVETYSPRSRTGAAHRRTSRATVRVIDGVPHVRFHGEDRRLVATWQDEAFGEPLARPIVWDLRLEGTVRFA